MAKLSSVLLPTTLVDTTGSAFKGAGYRNVGNGQHTVSIHTNAFTGDVYIEGSLASSPSSTDWFPIKLNGTDDYISYTLSTDVDHYTFVSNLIWVRARVANRSAGSIDQVLLSF